MDKLCIYHANCADGFAAALAVWLKWGDEAEYYPAQYGENPPDVSGKHVVIVDFSYKRDVMLEMKAKAKWLLVIDHHKTAEKELEGLDFCKFDMSKSGAVMAWEHFHKKRSLPLLFQYVQDRDLWRWELPQSKEFSAGLRLVEMDFKKWEYLLFDGAALDLKIDGESVLKYQQQCIDIALSKEIKRVDICGYNVPIVNCTHLISEIVGQLAVNEPFAVGYFDTPTKRVFSLRSAPDGVDVSVIAKIFGGGGHKPAAGFTKSLDDYFWNMITNG